MKKILIIVGALFLGLGIFLFFARGEIEIQKKNTFFSTAVMITDCFERELILSEREASTELKYVLLSDLDYNVSANDIDLENSYIAYSIENNSSLMYITLIGKGKYKKYSYVNMYKKDLSTKTIINNKNTLEQNLKNIKLIKYKEA